MRDNRDDDEGYGSSRDTSEQEFPERRHDDVLNKDMLKRRLKHFQLSDTDSNHATVIIGDRFSRLMAGYFKECLDDSGEFELTEYMYATRLLLLRLLTMVGMRTMSALEILSIVCFFVLSELPLHGAF
ncbi:hypothetical protein CLIM01_14654 [Colletotrichum limetticola]|uniref:Uncharacterized protein n=1 Tax=Colletotrichum limetticola TaxID=1209924 RepID=A0ABQ9PA40_9PEZI|nr:hypothetical protein CLIM01_14654 [Colletotrichum limetticola]